MPLAFTMRPSRTAKARRDLRERVRFLPTAASAPTGRLPVFIAFPSRSGGFTGASLRPIDDRAEGASSSPALEAQCEVRTMAPHASAVYCVTGPARFIVDLEAGAGGHIPSVELCAMTLQLDMSLPGSNGDRAPSRRIASPRSHSVLPPCSPTGTRSCHRDAGRRSEPCSRCSAASSRVRVADTRPAAQRPVSDVAFVG